jgi:glycine/D-amino acid oxidase-like deaminating enzyme/nitrite reductase/ring-hydroxylating ferredoxin subunit
MKSETPWQSVRVRRFSPLKKNQHFDAVVVGGGITGLSAAYQLKQAGQKVCLLERDHLGFVDTAMTTAHLTYVTDLRAYQLAKTFGEQRAKLVWEAGDLAINMIESIVNKHGIDCEFRRVPGFLSAPLAGDKDESKSLRRDAETADHLGFAARFVDSVPFFNRPGVLFADQAKFHPLKYLAGLAGAIEGDGSKIFEQSEVSEVKDQPLAVVANGKTIDTNFVVIATHVPLMGKTNLVSAALFQTKIFPYTSYAIGAKVPKGLLPEACFWDISDPYYYLRVEQGKTKDYVIFGGEDHKTGQEPNTKLRFKRLAATLLKLIPQAEPDRQWSGQVIETNDGLPYIGNMGGQFVATGFGGNGMTFGTLAGLMARDAALKIETPWQPLFSVSRKKIRGGIWNYLTENVDYPYYYLKDRLRGATATTTRQVKRGEGKIVDIQGQKMACSRDDAGKLHSVSAYCTHMGCLVRWNGAETTWDCPCHGSRFRPDGEVLAGPAETPLETVKKPSENGHTANGKRDAANGKAKAAPPKTVKEQTATAKAANGRNKKPRRRRASDSAANR